MIPKTALLASALRELFPTAHKISAIFDNGEITLIEVADKANEVLLDTANSTGLDMSVMNGAQRALENATGSSVDHALLIGSGWKKEDGYQGVYNLELPMSLADRAIWMGQKAVANETAARTKLAATLTDPAQGIAPEMMRTVLVAVADAAPWRKLLLGAQKKDALTVLLRLRAQVTEDLIAYGPQTSTCPVRSANYLIEQEGLRKFLSTTALFVDFDN